MAEIENRGPVLLGICIALLALTLTASLLRCYSRIGVSKAFGADDWTMMAATVSFILFVICAITGVHYGTGRHFKDLSVPNIQKAMMYWWFCYIWYCLTMIASKISIGIFLLRLTVKKIHHWIIYLCLLLTVVTGLVFFFVTLLQCSPIYYFWIRVDVNAKGTCIDTGIIVALTYLYSALNVICDFTFALLPVYLIMGLQMDKKTKIALIPILGMGCIASSAVVVRFAYIERFKDPDFLWATLDIAIWSTTEQALAITAGSLATLRPLFRSVAQRFGFSTQKSKIPRTDEMPKTIGSSANARSNVRNTKGSRGPFSLTTFMEEDNDLEANSKRDMDGDIKLNNVILRTTDITVNRSSKWGLSREGAQLNESEEELHIKSSKEGFGASRTTPKSFLDDGRSRHSDGSR